LLQEYLERTDLVRRSDRQEWRPYRAAPPRDADASPQAFLQDLIARDLRKRNIAPESKQKYQYARVVEELAQSVIEDIAAHPHWSESLRERYRQLVSMVEEFIDVCNPGHWLREPQPDHRDRLSILWQHRDFEKGVRAIYVDGESLADIAHAYLRQDARSGEFERLLVDALAAVDIYRCGEDLRKQDSLLVEKVDIPLVRRLVPRLSWRKRREVVNSSRLLNRMIEAYSALKHIEANPATCMELFESAAEAGADWDPAALIILKGRCAAVR
jgi:hypothetical protein